MKVFISVDMEGVTGITDPEDVLPDGADYQRGRVFMTGDANAAVLGAYDAAVFVGYHSCAGTEGGVLNHTLLGKEVQNLSLNGEPIGETRLNSLLAGHFGVPVVFVAGDTAVCNEAQGVLGNDLPTFAVKDGIDMFAASCLHPQ